MQSALYEFNVSDTYHVNTLYWHNKLIRSKFQAWFLYLFGSYIHLYPSINNNHHYSSMNINHTWSFQAHEHEYEHQMLCFISDIMSNMMNTFFTLLCIDWTIHTRGIMSNSDHNMAKCFVICFKDAMHND